MLPGLMLAVALTTDPAVALAWPVSERDAELATAEAALRDRTAESMACIEYFEGRKTKSVEYLKSIGGGTDEQRKVVAFLARRLEECTSELNETRDRTKEIQHLRQQERKLRAAPPKKEKR